MPNTDRYVITYWFHIFHSAALKARRVMSDSQQVDYIGTPTQTFVLILYMVPQFRVLLY